MADVILKCNKKCFVIFYRSICGVYKQPHPLNAIFLAPDLSAARNHAHRNYMREIDAMNKFVGLQIWAAGIVSASNTNLFAHFGPLLLFMSIYWLGCVRWRE